MNTDIFGKEERKQMLERIERMELANRAMTTTIASINEKLTALMDNVYKPEVDSQSAFDAATAMPMPSYSEMQEKRDEEFKARMDKIHEDGDAKFEEEMGVLRGIFDKLDKIQNGDELTKVQDLGSLVTSIEKANHGVNDIYDMGRAMLYREEQNGDVLKEIRSNIAETNSLLAAMLKKMDSVPVPPQMPPTQWVNSPNGTGGIKFTNTMPKGTTGGPPSDVSCDANPYIPEPPYGRDTPGNDRTFPGAEPLTEKEE